MHSPDVLRTQYPKERRFRRYNLHFPVCLTFSSAGKMRELATISKNVSTGGLLLEAENRIPLHTLVNLMMHVRGPAFRRPVKLVGEGEVVRVERLGRDNGFAIAIECKHEIADFDSAAGG